MDPITVAVIACVAAGLTKAGESEVGDAYTGLKAIIKKKLGAKNAVSEAIEGVEHNPDSKGREAVLMEEVVKAGVEKDPAVLKAVRALTDALEISAGKAAIDRERLRAGKIKIGELLAEGGTASIGMKDAKAKDSLEIGNITAKAKK